MPKIRNDSKRLKGYVKEFKPIFSLNDKSFEASTLFCNYCKKDIKCIDRPHIETHLNRKVHINSVPKEVEPKLVPQNVFNKDLCELFLCLNISLGKVNNIKLQ